MTSLPLFASPVDTDAFGDYRITRRPEDDRPLHRFGGRITTDGSTPFAAESGRYHVYAGWFCPWSQRVLISLELAGLRDVVTVSYVDDHRDGRGWAFRSTRGHDPVNSFTLLRDAYEATEAHFDGHISVPTLWDRVTGKVVSNQWHTIGIDLATQFRHLATPVVETYPADRADDIEQLDRWLGPAVNQGVSVAAGTSDAAAAARAVLIDTLIALDQRLARSRYLLGSQITEADVRLYVTLVRFDLSQNLDRSIHPGLQSLPNLWEYLRDLYSVPAFRSTTDFTSYLPAGSAVLVHLPDWEAPTNRARLLETVA